MWDGLCNRMLWTQTLNILADCFHKLFFLFLFSFLFFFLFFLLEIILHWFSLYILRTREIFWSRQVYINPGSILDRFYSTITVFCLLGFLSLFLVAVSVDQLYLIQKCWLGCLVLPSIVIFSSLCFQGRLVFCQLQFLFESDFFEFDESRSSDSGMKVMYCLEFNHYLH